MRCDNCGADNKNDARFCRKCGSQLGTEFSDEHNKTLGVPSKHHYIAVVTTCLLAFTIIISFMIIRMSNVKVNITDEYEMSDSIFITNDLYCSVPAKEHIVNDSKDNVTFVNNELIIYLDIDSAQEDITTITDKY